MPILTPLTGEILVALFTIGWGITVESWYVSRHTIWYNIVPLLVMMTTLTLSAETFLFLAGYVLASITLVNATGNDGHTIKQLVGAKTYGVIMLILGMNGGPEYDVNGITLQFILITGLVFLLWWVVRKRKKEKKRDWYLHS